MTWNVNATGTPAEVRGQLAHQFSLLLTFDGGLPDEGVKQTVQLLFELCEQILSTFDEGESLTIIATGHTGLGRYQALTLSVTPIKVTRGRVCSTATNLTASRGH